MKGELSKLAFLRGLDAHTLDLSMLPAGRRLTPQALERRDPHRRHPILLTLLAQSAVDVLDEVVQLFDQAVSGREGRARRRMTEALAERAHGGEDRQALLDDLLAVITDTASPDDEIGGLLRGDRIGCERLRAATVTWRCWSPPTGTCASLPGRSSRRSASSAGPPQARCSRRRRLCAGSTPPAPARPPTARPPSSCPPAGAATSTRLVAGEPRTGRGDPESWVGEHGRDIVVGRDQPRRLTVGGDHSVTGAWPRSWV